MGKKKLTWSVNVDAFCGRLDEVQVGVQRVVWGEERRHRALLVAVGGKELRLVILALVVVALDNAVH